MTLNTRRIEISDPKVAQYVTDEIIKKAAILRNKNGNFISLASHQITRDLINFLEPDGYIVEYTEKKSKSGKREIRGIPVIVRALKHNNYDGGVVIRVKEESSTDRSNTNKIIDWLNKKGISMEKACLEVVETECRL